VCKCLRSLRYYQFRLIPQTFFMTTLIKKEYTLAKAKLYVGIKKDMLGSSNDSDNQIDYAENDERGLLTTWQLYNQYKLIENGVFTREETRDSLVEWGLISLIPKNLIGVGVYDEYFKKPKAGILMLNNVRIKVGDEIYAHKGERWIRTQIASLQLNGENVDCADSGEVGIVTAVELEKGFEIFIKNGVVNES